MKTAFFFHLLLALGAAGCASNPNIMTPRISPALTEANRDLPIEAFRASADWVPGYGHGLSIEVWVTRNAADYRRDLGLELEGAAKVCAALAKSDAVLEWEFIDVRFFSEYGRIPPRSRSVAGVARVIIRRETLRTLRERNVPASEYPRYWDFVHGYKDQPDSKALLSW